MENLKALLAEIAQLTSTMETDYPELYRFLDENPMTLPIKEHPKMDKKVMEEYLEDLKELIKRHVQTHGAK